MTSSGRHQVEGYFIDDKHMATYDDQWKERGTCFWELTETSNIGGETIPMTYNLSNGDCFRRLTNRHSPPQISGKWKDAAGRDWEMVQNGQSATLTSGQRIVDIFFSFREGEWHLISKEGAGCQVWNEVDEDTYTLTNGDRFHRERTTAIKPAKKSEGKKRGKHT